MASLSPCATRLEKRKELKDTTSKTRRFSATWGPASHADLPSRLRWPGAAIDRPTKTAMVNKEFTFTSPSSAVTWMLVVLAEPPPPSLPVRSYPLGLPSELKEKLGYTVEGGKWEAVRREEESPSSMAETGSKWDQFSGSVREFLHFHEWTRLEKTNPRWRLREQDAGRRSLPSNRWLLRRPGGLSKMLCRGGSPCRCSSLFLSLSGLGKMGPNAHSAKAVAKKRRLGDKWDGKGPPPTQGVPKDERKKTRYMQKDADPTWVLWGSAGGDSNSAIETRDVCTDGRWCCWAAPIPAAFPATPRPSDTLAGAPSRTQACPMASCMCELACQAARVSTPSAACRGSTRHLRRPSHWFLSREFPPPGWSRAPHSHSERDWTWATM